MRPGKPWQPWELQLLRNTYPIHGAEPTMRETGRTRASVCGRANRLGLECGPHRRWTADDDQLLRQRYGRVPVDELARELERSVPAIRERTRRIGVAGQSHRQRGHALSEEEAQAADALYARGMSYHAIAEELGVSHMTVARYVLPEIRAAYRRKLLKSIRRRLQRGEGQVERQPAA